MAARHTRLILALVCALLLTAQHQAASSQRQPAGTPTASTPRRVTRIVSLVPAITEVLFAIGAGPKVVGVSSFDAFPPAVNALPRVGALLDPDTERILTLHPDLVITYETQGDIEKRFERAGIMVFSYRHSGIDGMLDTMRRIGEIVGSTQEASAAVRALQQRLASIRARVKGLPRPRTLLVFERTPQTLRDLYVSGGTGFLNDMLDVAGAVNVFADITRESVQPSQETLIARAPEVIVEIRAKPIADDADARRDHAVWNTLVSIPAVRQHRLYFLSGDQLVVPGPRLADGAEMIARALHPDAFR
jgi:iron complex transport system substrate-binding protein